MLSPTRDDVWLCLHLYEQRREPVLRTARDWMFDFTPRSFKEVKDVLEGRAGEEANRYWRQASSYWEMIATLMNSGALSAECVDLFSRTTREYFVCYAKVAPYLEQIRAMTRPATLQNLERFCKSLPDHDGLLAYFTKMSDMIRARKKNVARAKGRKRKARR